MSDLFLQQGDLAVQEFQHVQPLAEQEPVMVADVAVQGLLQLRDFVPQCAFGQLRQLGGIGLAVDDRLEDGAAGGSHDVGGHHAELQVGIFQRLFDAADDAGALLGQGGSHAGEIAELPDGQRWNEAAAEQSVLQQIGDALAVLENPFSYREWILSAAD